jgi:hypothetical protein
MFNRSHATLLALVCSAGFAAHAQATGGNYSQSFAATPSGWSTALGAWNVTSGDYRNAVNTASPATISWYDTNSWTTNYTYKARAYSEWPSTGNQVGLVFGLTDSTHYYAALVNMSGAVTINQISGTSNTTLVSGSVDPGTVGLAEDTAFDLDIFVNQRKHPSTGANDGSEVTVRVNGRVAIAKFPLTTVAGKIGLIARADLGHFDDVTVTDNLAARLFRGTMSGLNSPLQLALDSSSCSTTSEGRHSCWGDITGQDQSGDTWPFHLWGDDARLQFNSKSLDPAVQDYVDATLVSVPGHVNMNPDGSGGNTTGALSFALKKMESLHHPPQILYNVQPVPSVPQHDLYMRFWAKIPGNSELSYWHSLWQMKTSSDLRLIFNIESGNAVTNCAATGVPRWTIAADDSANSTKTQTFWKECNGSVPVPLNKWFKVEMFLHRSQTGQGRFWAAIDNQQIFDKRDANGLYAPGSSQPIDRLLLPQLYGGDTYPKYELVDDMEVWDNFPADASPH